MRFKLSGLSSCFELLDVYILTHSSSLQELLGLVEAKTQSFLKLTVGNLCLAVLHHEIDLLGIAIEVYAARANLLLNLPWYLETDGHRFPPQESLHGAKVLLYR